MYGTRGEYYRYYPRFLRTREIIREYFLLLPRLAEVRAEITPVLFLSYVRTRGMATFFRGKCDRKWWPPRSPEVAAIFGPLSKEKCGHSRAVR